MHNELLNLFVLSEIIWIHRGKCSEFPKWDRSIIINNKEITIPLAKSYSYNMDYCLRSRRSSSSPPREEWVFSKNFRVISCNALFGLVHLSNVRYNGLIPTIFQSALIASTPQTSCSLLLETTHSFTSCIVHHFTHNFLCSRLG